ncbi:hypothetical protein [Microtetraspora malaysiensis]|uniref:Minor tail protein n=1 Tax=Microtetraspora malaysiensis TaxID=161358 RepID=A0ABW6T321_9ACTN
MASVPAPRTWTVGEQLTAAKLNNELRNALNFLLAPPLCKLGLSVNAALGSGGGRIPWSVEEVDRDDGHSISTDTTRYTAKTAGYYATECTVGIMPNSATKYRGLYIERNGDGTSGIGRIQVAPVNDTTLGTTVNVAASAFLSVGEYLEVRMVQDPGVSMSVYAAGTVWTLRWVSI